MKRVEAHVFAGLGGFLFARGTKALDRLMDDLRKEWDATHWWHREWEKACDGIIARQKRFKDKPTVILIGHSFGALRCQQIAARLNSHGITVHYIGCIDATALPAGEDPMRITGNVKDVDEFWSTRGIINAPRYVRWRDPEGGRGGKYIYPKGWEGTKAIYKVNASHVPCASDPLTVNTIMNKVRALV